MSGHTLGDIARAIGVRLEGVAERAVAGMATLAEAGPSERCYAASSAPDWRLTGIHPSAEIAKDAKIAADAAIGAVVMADLEPGAKVWGSPARRMARAMRERAALTRLPELLRALRRQEKELDELRDRIARLELRESK